MSSDSASELTTASNRLFASYLQSVGLHYQYEPTEEGKSKNPDFRVLCDNQSVRCEVKELYRRRPEPRGGSSFDPYTPIRHAIKKAEPQFREYRDEPCVLVLCNINDWEFCDRPVILYGAMLGDLGFTMKLNLDDQAHAVPAPVGNNAFLENGSVLKTRRRSTPTGPTVTKQYVQNTTFSAIAVLTEFTVPNPAFWAEFTRRFEALGRRENRDPTMYDWVQVRIDLELERNLAPTLGQTPRLCVFENPFARVPLPEACLSGPVDARYRFTPRNGGISKVQRVFAGDGLVAAETMRPDSESPILRRVEPFREAVIRRFHPQRIVLFGSHARGAAEPGSDVDLLVTFAGDANEGERSLEIRTPIEPEFPLDLITRSEGEIAKRLALNDMFLREILDHGVTLYDAAHA